MSVLVERPVAPPARRRRACIACNVPFDRDHQRGNIQAVHRPQHQSSYDSCKKQLIMRAMASQQAGSRGAHAPQQHQQPHHRVVARARGRIHAASADIHVHPSQGLDGSASSCPFLASLPQPPQAQIPWWDRLQQAFNPPSFQRRVLSGNSLVHLPPQMLFPEAYMVATGDLAKQIFSGETDGSTMVATQRLPRAVKLFGKNSMLWVPEPRHSFLRNLMQPAFTPEAIARYLPRVEAVVGRWLSSWADVGEAVPGHPGFSAMTFDFILQVVFGRDFTPEHVMRLSKVFKTFTMGFMAWPYQAIPFTRYGQAVQARQQLVDEFMVLVREERQHLEGGGEPHGLLGMMLLAQDEQGFKLTDEELQDNLILLLLAGHDTSSSTLALLMVNLQKHPEVVLKLRQEQQQILSKRGPAFTAGVLKDMTYADAVIRETLRKDNIVSASGRLTARDLDLGGYQVPAGTLVQIPLTYLSEQDPRWAGQQGDLDPAVFNPERMLSKEGAKPGWIMPFGHGPRYCLGAALAFVEMKVFLALLARSYEFHVEPDTDWTFAIGRVPNNGLPMTITRGVPSHALTQQMVAV